MPIYMDRHDGVPGLSHDELLQAHVADEEIGAEYGVSFLTFWHDARRGHIFCLMDAPDYETAWTVHAKSHGNMPSDLIEVQLPAVEAFLGRVCDPPGLRTGVHPGAAFRAIMFTDIAGSTEMTSRLGDALGVEMVQAHDAIVRRKLVEHGGREIKHTGDGLMVSFDQPAAAAACARSMQRAFAVFNTEAEHKLNVRVGVHVGQPVMENNDLFGSAVQMAARLCQAATPGAVCVSTDMADLLEGGAAAVRPLGVHRLKGFEEPVELFELILAD